ncbi:hypothetical protein HY383_01395 [Candidatus Daviesbacteria bacterium]|nr:hypothetical protein [Candidatus Daviesbacteria bacterium]
MQKGLAPILIVFLIALAVGGYLIYQKQIKPVPQHTTESTPTPAVDETANWKTYKDNEGGFMFNYPDNWIVKAEETNYSGSIENPNLKIPNKNIALRDKNSSASISIKLNFQGGICEGGGCTEEEYRTQTGILGKKITSESSSYYSLRIEPNNLFIITDTKSQSKEVNKIINSISPLN